MSVENAAPAAPAGFSGVCNECDSHEFTDTVKEADLDYLACSGCGGDEFHKEPKPNADLCTAA
jgi:hypothetical protein